MKKLIPILLFALIFTGCTGISNNQYSTYRQITMDEAVAMMAQETGYIILDVRRADEFATGHIPGAINVANETIGTDEVPELPDKNQLIWCTAVADDAVKRRPRSWSSWVIRTLWSSAGSSIGRARSKLNSWVKFLTAVSKEKGWKIC